MGFHPNAGKLWNIPCHQRKKQDVPCLKGGGFPPSQRAGLLPTFCIKGLRLPSLLGEVGAELPVLCLRQRGGYFPTKSKVGAYVVLKERGFDAIEQ